MLTVDYEKFELRAGDLLLQTQLECYHVGSDCFVSFATDSDLALQSLRLASIVVGRM